jgi:hypothetical protein
VVIRRSNEWAAALLGFFVALACSPKSGNPFERHPKPLRDAGVPEASLLHVSEPDAAPLFDPGEGGVPPGRLGTSKVDLLFVIDDSSSMADKHQVLKDAVPDLLKRLANPICMDSSGKTSQPATPEDACAFGTRQFAPVRDIHLGIVTSSLGGGAHISGCSPTIGGAGNDGAHFAGLLAREQAVPTYAGSGFLVWDPDQAASPPGETDLDHLVATFRSQVDAIGQKGCGLESSLEAWYRALIDPEPVTGPPDPSCATSAPTDAGTDAGPHCSVASRLDHTVLEQRARFLRDDSLVLVMMLTDENDCSMSGTIARSLVADSYSDPPRGSAACATNPNDRCCYPCTATKPPTGCPSPDAACAQGATDPTAQLNLSCFHEKQRFGVDALFPVQRYVDGLTKKQITSSSGALVENPLFKGGLRGTADVFLVGIVGVPWQDTATPDSLTSAAQLRLIASSQFESAGGWDLVLGNSALGKPPSDALVIESVEPRKGTDPVIGAALQPPTASELANPINGHERNIIGNDDLQYSCIFRLPTPRDCSATTSSCDCATPTDGTDNPVCQMQDGTYTTTQRYAKAFPPPRILEVLRAIGGSGVLASICPKNAYDDTREDYGYRPVIGAAIQEVAPVLLQ